MHLRVEEKESCKLFQQIMSGVRYLHKMGVVHRYGLKACSLFNEKS